MRTVMILTVLLILVGFLLPVSTGQESHESLELNNGFRKSLVAKLKRGEQAMMLNSVIHARLSEIINDLSRGPLAGKIITLLFDAEVDKMIGIDDLLKATEKPISLMKISLGDDVKEDADLEFRSGNFNTSGSECLDAAEENNTLENCGDSNVPFSEGKTVLLLITNGEEDSLRRLPLPPSSPLGLVILSLKENCNASALLQTPIALQGPNVALLCPVPDRRIRKKSSPTLNRETPVVQFRVYAWRPFLPTRNLVPMGAWSSSTFSSWKDLFIDRFPSFHGLTLHASGVTIDPPYYYRKNGSSEIEGLCRTICDELGRWLNFTVTYTNMTRDRTWGNLINGTWTGQFGEVWRGEKNFTINTLHVTQSRWKSFDVSVPIAREGFAFVSRIPLPLPRWRNLGYSLTPFVWGGFAASALVMTLMFYLLVREEDPVMASQSFFIITQSLFNQGLNRLPRKWPVRVFLLLWWFSALIFVVCYTSNLISLLSMAVVPGKLHTVQDLAESDYSVCAMDFESMVYGALATSNDTHLVTIHSKLDFRKPSFTYFFGQEQCVETVMKGGHFQVEFFPLLEFMYVVMGYGNSVYYLPEKLFEGDVAFFFPKNTPWKHKFDIGIRRMVESGLTVKWYDDNINAMGRYNVKVRSESTKQPLSLSHLQGPFIILSLGLCLATVLFLCEYLFVWWSSR